ncbi:hypothetical protein UCDDS831_g00873 [Diplodia seriata]|uniref:Uncharacterized protein n=1 Tax=Diplodia seriata TaxID=420778 RepID=A0A0G2GVM6_9PEZI|nr:hypothetical protein UCDDS831_g00873 [Diplodia seriata]
MPLEVPEDVLYILCDKLADAKDFDTLFHHHDASPVIGGGGDGQPPPKVQKWSVMWRSIIAASLEVTAFPYCRYIKTLDFRDLIVLLELFQDPKFTRKDIMKYVFSSQDFFSGEMSAFKIMNKVGKKGVLDVSSTVEAIGDAMTPHTPFVEVITGNVKASALIKWPPKLPRLTSLQLWAGDALSDPKAQDAIIAHCPKFDALSFYIWIGEAADQQLASFLSGLQPQQLRYFETISHADLGEGALLSLSSHGESLKNLKMALRPGTIPHLGLLKTCTALESLELEYSNSRENPLDLEATQHDVFVEVQQWLCECKSLSNLQFSGIFSALKLVTPVLLQHDIKLSHLSVDCYEAHNAGEFHRALTHQTTLQWLQLTADSDAMLRDDIDVIVETLTRLEQLKHIKLIGVSDFFNDEHIIALARSLPHLDDVYFTGLQVGDAILPELANLKDLRRLEVASIRIEFRVEAAAPESKLSDEELQVINQKLTSKVDGKLEWVLYRDPQEEQIDESDSD